MRRRDFLASSFAAAGMISLRHVFGNNETAMREMVEPMNFKKEVLQLLENDFLKVTINSDASMEVFDKKRQQAWQSGPVAMQEEGPIDRGYVFNRTDRSICEQYPGRFAGTKEGDNIRFMLIGRQNEKMGEFVVGYHLEKDEMVVRIIKIDENIPSFPGGVIVRPNGRYMTGGIWSARQCYILNSRNSLDYLKRNWKHLKTLGLKSMYIDTLTTMELYQSFEKGNTQTREQDFNQRQKIVKFLYENGIAMGSENISEITVMYGAYGNIHDYSRVQGENIPLFQLVFGDSCLINTGMKRTEKNKAWFNRHLNRIANGSFMTHGCWMKKWDKSMLEPFKNSFHVDEWHGKIATSELVNHRFLDDEYMVEELEYANGHKAVVNFGDNNFSFEGKTVKGNDYITT